MMILRVLLYGLLLSGIALRECCARVMRGAG
jgi:hypothetical protein